MQCIKTVSYTYLINGEAKGLVIPERGIRQGDPLSPYIIIFCIEVLSGLCHQAEHNGTLRGIRVAQQSPRVNHLLFADDTLFFCRTNAQSVATLQNILLLYEQASGQRINQAKSAITFSNKASQTLKARVKDTLDIHNEGGTGKYLGLPEHINRRKRDTFTGIVDKIRQRAISWSSRKLSSAGKLTLLCSLCNAQPYDELLQTPRVSLQKNPINVNPLLVG